MDDDFRIQIPDSALAELEAVAEMDWGDGIGLTELIEWINQVVERFRPESVNDGARSSAAFTPRSFRHYQTMGCIDAPKRTGKSVAYGFKHYLQGLLIRKLLWEKVPSDQIVKIIAGRSTGELKRLLLEGIEIVAAGESVHTGHLTKVVSSWKRITLSPGVELHLDSSRERLSKKEVEEMLGYLRDVLLDG